MQELVPPKATARKDRRSKDGFTYRCDAAVAIPGRPSARVTATGTSKREAKQNWLLRAERMRSGLVRAEMPLSDYLDSWLRVHEGKARPTTIARYRSDVQKYLKPKFKGYTLDQITYDMVEEYVAELRKGGLREKTVRHIVSTLSSAMSSAFKKRLIPMNPARDIQVVKDENPRIPEWVAPPVMLDLLLMEPESPQRDLLIVLTVLPLRLNEARGMQYLDLQQSYTYLDLREAVSKDPNATRRTLKTSQSQRGIQLPLPVQAVVQRALARRGDGPVPTNGWVFERGDGKPISVNQVRGWWEAFKARKGLSKRLRIHDLRAGFARHLLELGAAIGDVSAALGHTNSRVTIDSYTAGTALTGSKAINQVWSQQSPPKSPPSAENGVDERTAPNVGKAAFHEGRSGGEGGIRTLDGIAPEPHFQCGAIDH